MDGVIRRNKFCKSTYICMYSLLNDELHVMHTVIYFNFVLIKVTVCKCCHGLDTALSYTKYINSVIKQKCLRPGLTLWSLTSEINNTGYLYHSLWEWEGTLDSKRGFYFKSWCVQSRTIARYKDLCTFHKGQFVMARQLCLISNTAENSVFVSTISSGQQLKINLSGTREKQW